MRGSIDVVWCPNPMRPVGDRQVCSLLLTGTDTIDSVVRRLALQGTPLNVTLNGVDVRRRRWSRKRVRVHDVLVLRQRAHGAEVGAYAAATASAKGGVTLATAVAIGAVVTFVANIVISLAISALLASLSKKSAGSNGTDNSPAAYGIEGGSNTMRPYEPLPLILGEHRIFPDYASRPFTEFVPDPSTLTDVYNTTVVKQDQTRPAFIFIPAEPPIDGMAPDDPTANPPWVLIETIYGPGSGETEAGPGAEGEPLLYIFGDEVERTYRKPGSFGGLGAPYTSAHTFVLRYNVVTAAIALATWEDYEIYLANPIPTFDPWHAATTLPVIIRYGYQVTYNTERLASIFNFGFGDLTINDLLIGASSTSSFNGVQRDDSTVPAGAGDRTQLLGYTSANWPGNRYPGNVQLVDGGKLEQHPLAVNGGWIERQGSEGCKYLQVDIAGRLFMQSGGGTENLSCSFEAEYQQVGSDVWQPLPFSPFTLTNGSTVTVRHTMSCMLGVDADAVRVRRTTPDATDTTQISEFECTRVKFFRNGDALYPAQRRMGLLIKATGQLSGRVERLSAFVRAKHWVWASGAPWDGSMPANGSGAWVWTHTVNPAWLFLFYARGGFLNPTAAPAHLGLAGWLDQPAVGNGPRIFGAGLTNDRIDYATIIAWGQFCAAANLECRMAVTGARSAGEVLDDIAAAGRATKSWAPGKLSAVWEAADQPVVAAFGMSNIVAGSFKVSYSSDDSVDEYALNYTRSDDGYEADTVYATVPGVALPVNQSTQQAVYSMPRAQAQRLVNLLAAARHFHRRVIRWETNIMGLTVQRGDVIRLAHDLTRWAYSGRLVDLVAVGGAITQVTLSAEVENPTGSGTFYLWICKPTGQYLTVACAPPAQRTRTLQVTSAWSTADAPGVLTGVVNNPASTNPGSIPEDWTFFAGPTPTPGKRARIVNIEPSSARRVRITARDEYEAYYPLEWGVGGAPDPVSGEQLVARAFNLSISSAAEGGTRLAWELEAAHGAHVMVSVNGGAATQVPVQGYLTVSGTELLLPAYAPGTHLGIQVLPVPAGVPVAIQGDSLELTV